MCRVRQRAADDSSEEGSGKAGAPGVRNASRKECAFTRTERKAKKQGLILCGDVIPSDTGSPFHVIWGGGACDVIQGCCLHWPLAWPLTSATLASAWPASAPSCPAWIWPHAGLASRDLGSRLGGGAGRGCLGSPRHPH